MVVNDVRNVNGHDIVQFLQIRDIDNVIYVSVQIKEKQNAYFSDVFRIRIIELMNR